MPSTYNGNNTRIARPAEQSAMYEQMRNTASQKVQSGLNEGYKPSKQVSDSYSRWTGLQAQKPLNYKSSYTQQLNDLMAQVMNRPKFSYDVNGDMLYQQARDQYMLNGRQAMKDTIGQASAMTGGYGNSYAASAGNQAYQSYLTQLMSQIPEFYDRAYQAYQDEGDRMRANYGMLSERENQDYSRYRDTRADWENDVNRAMQEYSTLYSQDYGRYADDLSNAYNALGQAESAYQSDRAYDYQVERDQVADSQWQQQFDWQRAQYDKNYANDIVMSLLGSGKMPSADMLSAAGLSAADAKLFIDIYNRDHPAPAPAPAASGNSSRNNNNNGGKGTVIKIMGPQTQPVTVDAVTGTGKSASQGAAMNIVSMLAGKDNRKK